MSMINRFQSLIQREKSIHLRVTNKSSYIKILSVYMHEYFHQLMEESNIGHENGNV